MLREKDIIKYTPGVNSRFSRLIMIYILFIAVIFAGVFAGYRFFVKGKGNVKGLYLEALNMSMPTIDYEEDHRSKAIASYGNFLPLLLQFTKNPLNIVGREISYYGTEIGRSYAGEEDQLQVFNESAEVTPFNLQEVNIQYFKNENSNPEGENVNASNNPAEGVHDPKYKKPLDKSKPEVLIYHTHTSEKYTPTDTKITGGGLTVQAVGAELAKNLEENYGIAVIHDTTIHDDISYQYAYSASAKTLDKYLKAYGNFKLIIDMHRDSATDRKNTLTKINNESIAKIMFVMSTNNPTFKKNSAVVNSLIKISDSLFPNFCRGIYYYKNNVKNHFNAEKSTTAVLIEVGSDKNTIEDATGSAKYMARIIGQYINGGQ